MIKINKTQRDTKTKNTYIYNILINKKWDI